MVESQKKIKEIKFNDISHPLDPLTSEEINLVTSIVKNKSNIGKFLLFETITLIEPPKNQVLSFNLEMLKNLYTQNIILIKISDM